MMRVRYLASAPLLLLAACGQSADPAAVLQTVRDTEKAQAEAIAARDLGGAVRNYSPDAVMVGPAGAPASGASAIRATYRALLADPNHAIEVTPGAGWAAASGDMAVTTSTARVTRTDPVSGDAVTVPLTTQTVWRKASGAPWLIVSEQNVALASTPEAAAGG